MTEKQIREKITEHLSAVCALREELDHRARRKRLRCGFCGKSHQVSKLTLIQTHYYVRPYSCTGGDYWNMGEKQYECPSCGERMRDPGDNEYLAKYRQLDKRIGELARFFGETVKEYER